MSYLIAYPGLGDPTAGDVLVVGCPLVPSSCILLQRQQCAPTVAGRVARTHAPWRGMNWQEAACGQAALTLLPWHHVQTSWGDVIFPKAGALGA